MTERKRAERVPAHVGAQMRKWRRVAGRSLQEVAHTIGCSKGHLSSAENGHGNLSLPLFLDFCDAIDAPASKVLEERLLKKHRDVDRLASEIVGHSSLAEMQWLASLSRDELRTVLRRGHEAVEYARSKRRSQDDPRPGRASRT